MNQSIVKSIHTFHTLLSVYLLCGWMIPSNGNHRFLTLFVPTVYVNWLIDDHRCMFTRLEQYFQGDKKKEENQEAGFIQDKLKHYNIDISEKKLNIILTFITYHTFLQSYYRSFY
jgi:hypothetical protein